jgi:hypothetical protein
MISPRKNLLLRKYGEGPIPTQGCRASKEEEEGEEESTNLKIRITVESKLRERTFSSFL